MEPVGGSTRRVKIHLDFAGFWRENEMCGKGIDAIAFVLRAVLANSPNSVSPRASLLSAE